MVVVTSICSRRNRRKGKLHPARFVKKALLKPEQGTIPMAKAIAIEMVIAKRIYHSVSRKKERSLAADATAVVVMVMMHLLLLLLHKRKDDGWRIQTVALTI